MKILISILVGMCVQTTFGFPLDASVMSHSSLSRSSRWPENLRYEEPAWNIACLSMLSIRQSVGRSSSRDKVNLRIIEDRLYDHLVKAVEFWVKGNNWTISRSEARAGLRRELFIVASCPDTMAIVNASKRLWKEKSDEREMVLDLLQPLIFYTPVPPSPDHRHDVLPWRMINGKLSLPDEYPARGPAGNGRRMRIRSVFGPYSGRRKDLARYLTVPDHGE